MKNYVLGIMAIVIAVSLSAYTAKPVTKKHTVTQQPYFWYPVDGTLTIIGPAFNSGGSAMTLDDAIPVNPEICDNTGSRACYVGELVDNYEQSSTTPSAATADNRLHEKQ